MLCQFSFKNYKSYKDETTIEMQAENTNEFVETLIDSTKDEKKFLPIIAIYGPNGGGKTNALEAFVTLVDNIIRPIQLLNKAASTEGMPIIPYKFTNKKNVSTEFEVFYRIEYDEFRYNISFFNNTIEFESLYVLTQNAKRPTKIFVRENNNIELGDELKKGKVKINNNQMIPFLSFLAISYNIPLITKAISFFMNTVLINCGNDEYENMILMDILAGGKTKSEFLNLLKMMDIDIIDYRIEKIPNFENSVQIYTKHIKDKTEYELKLGEESKGTQKLFALLPMIINSLKSGSLTIIDEFDAKLHPKLIEYLLGLYKEKKINKKGAQLIISSHDLTTMTHDVFRRDEILFSAKDESEASHIYSLYEIRDENGEHIRMTSSYNKQYIEGRYGADPYLQQIQKWEE